MQEKVSIIMGVYNNADTISQALDSIISQTYSNWELIVCDDKSVDDSLNILKKYAKCDSRIKLIQNEKNIGLAASLNHCLEYVQGAYIARMDGDDVSDETRIEKQVSFLSLHKEIHLVGTYMQELKDGKLGEIIKGKLFPTKYDLPKGAPFAHATVLMRTEVMKTLQGYHISAHTVRTEDVDLWYRFFSMGYKGANLEEPLYYVRMDEAAYKRRKLKYMFHASYIIWYGCDMVKLPKYYKVYCIKPLLSWILPRKLKNILRKFVIS